MTPVARGSLKARNHSGTCHLCGGGMSCHLTSGLQLAQHIRDDLPSSVVPRSSSHVSISGAATPAHFPGSGGIVAFPSMTCMPFPLNEVTCLDASFYGSISQPLGQCSSSRRYYRRGSRRPCTSRFACRRTDGKTVRTAYGWASKNCPIEPIGEPGSAISA